MMEPLTTPVTYSPSLTIPLTHACAWNCGYCGYRDEVGGLMSEAEITRHLDLARQQGVTEILFLSGEIPDTIPRLQQELRKRGYESFLEFALAVGKRALDLGFLPHSNFGALSEAQLLALKEVNASQGLMLENVDAIFNRTVAPDKGVEGRLKTLAAAGRAKIPYTSGILIGLGETPASRRASLNALAELQREYGHLQEIILQNYVPNAGSRWPAQQIELPEYLDLIATWREIAPEVAIQIPPNLNSSWRELLPYVDDLGGISAEGDEVNPENPWARVEVYREAVEAAGRTLVPRLPVYEAYQGRPWLSPAVRARVEAHAKRRPVLPRRSIWEWSTEELRMAAAEANQKLNGDTVTYVVNRNANFTNICNVGCAFCGFQRKKNDADAYLREPGEIVARLAETPEITEVCIQGGIHPELKLEAYLELLRTIKAWRPDLHIHAYSPMEIHSLCEKTGWSPEKVLGELQAAGLDTIPGTAAEILDDGVRQEISSRKLNSAQWIKIITAAHRLGLRSTATIMYGHVESWAQIRSHFETLHKIQEKTGGFTELVPLEFVPQENPLGHRIRPDPALVQEKRERIYPLARLFFGASLPHLQTSWVKLGRTEAVKSLAWGCDDFGGTLYEESITRSSGGSHGEVLLASEIRELIEQAGKVPRQRRTLYS